VNAWTYAPGDFRLGVIIEPGVNGSGSKNVTVCRLPGGSYLHMYPAFGTLFPGVATSVEIVLRYSEELAIELPVTIRIFSAAGFRDFPLLCGRAEGLFSV
jgi:hypothetical protein